MYKLKMLLLQNVMLPEVATLLFRGYGFLRKKVSNVSLLRYQLSELCILIVYFGGGGFFFVCLFFG